MNATSLRIEVEHPHHPHHPATRYLCLGLSCLQTSWLLLWCVLLRSLRIQDSTGSGNGSRVQISSVAVLSNSICDSLVGPVTVSVVFSKTNLLAIL